MHDTSLIRRLPLLSQLQFTLVYAWRSIVRNPQRALFALLSISAGVATVTTLRILGLMLTDALTANAQAFLRSDILVAAAASPLRLGASSDVNNEALFLPPDTAKLNQWAEAHNVEIMYRLSGQVFQIVATNRDVEQGALAFGYFVDAEQYPYYDTIRASEPAAALLSELFREAHSVVVARRLADQLNLIVGDTLRIGSADTPFVVSGIVPDASENNIDNPLGIALSFVYLDQSTLPEFGISPGTADRAYLKLPPSIDPEVFVDEVYEEWRDLVPSLTDRHVRYDRVGNILQRNALIAGFISRAVLILSLVALVIGGIGIMNTMAVTVSRRSQEIASLKTIGLRRLSIAFLFFVHALLLGIFGSVLGIGLGIVFSLAAKTVGETTFGVTLTWALTPDPVALGLVLGIGATALFSLLPTFSAARVAPRILLRQVDVSLTRAGRIPTVVTVSLMIVSIGLLIDLILGIGNRAPFAVSSLLTGIVVAAVAFVVFALWALLLSAVVWVLGRLPTLGSAQLRLALRGIALHRGRTTFALLALVTGMTALSATLILSRSISVLLFTSVSEPIGGNLVVIPVAPLMQQPIHAQLNESDAVTSFSDVSVAQAALLAIDGDPLYRVKLGAERDRETEAYLQQLAFITGVRTFGEQDTSQLLAGRLLSPDDEGQYRIVIPYNLALVRLGVTVGSTFTYQLGSEAHMFSVVGIVRPRPQSGLAPFGLGSNSVQAPYDVVPSDLPFPMTVANVQRSAIPRLSQSLRSIPGVFVIDLGTFDSIINRVLRQMSALPLLIAGLSLFAASVLVATTVALSTQERRREIGVLKAIGLKRWHILTQLLVQNALIGFAGGLISLLPTIGIVALVPVITDEIVQLPLPLDLIIAMLGLSTGITVVATLLTGWRASGEKAVAALRYE